MPLITADDHPSLILWYDGQVSGNTILDRSANGIDGTATDVIPITGTTGLLGGAGGFGLDGITSAIVIPDHIKFDDMLTSFTISMMIDSTTNPSWRSIINQYTEGDAAFNIRFNSTTGVQGGLYPTGASASRYSVDHNPLANQGWVHLVLRYEASTKLRMDLYYYDVTTAQFDQTTNAVPATMFSSSSPMEIGRLAQAPGSETDMDVQQIRIYSEYITDADLILLRDEVYVAPGAGTPVIQAYDVVYDIANTDLLKEYAVLKAALTTNASAPLQSSLVINSSHAITYDIVAAVKQAHEILYSISNTEPLQSSETLLTPLVLGASHTMQYDIVEALRAAADISLNMLPAIKQAHDISTILQINNALSSAYALSIPMTDDTARSVSVGAEAYILVDPAVLALAYPGAAVNHTGATVPFYHKIEHDGLSIDMAEGDTVWSCSVSLVSRSDYILALPSFGLRVIMGGDTYDFLIDGVSVGKTEGSPNLNATIEGVTNTAMYENPRHASISRVWETPALASTIVGDLLAGVPLAWGIVDWVLPANRVALENGAPLALASAIVEAAGGVLEPDFVTGFIVRYRYPVSIPNLASNVDVAFGTSQDLLSCTLSYALGDYYDRLRISETDAEFQDVIEFIESENDATQGVLRVFPAPWSEDVTVSHTSEPTVTLGSGVVNTESITEIIEILHAVGSSKYPIDTLDNVRWLSTDLSGIVFTQGSSDISTTSSSELHSLCEITYTTKFIEYAMSSPTEKDIQFLVNRPEE